MTTPQRQGFRRDAGLPYSPKSWNDLNRALFDSFKQVCASSLQVETIDYPVLARLARSDASLAETLQRAVGRGVQAGANCYAYVADDDGNPPGYLALPGEISGWPHVDGAALLAEMPDRLRSDGFRALAGPADLLPDEYSVAAFWDPVRNKPHFYRRNDDGTWSHKPGDQAVTQLDAKGEVIRNPERACRHYKSENLGELDYSEFLGYQAVPKEGLKVGVPVAVRAAVKEALGDPAALQAIPGYAAWSQGFPLYKLAVSPF